MLDFFDSDMLQLFKSERFLIDQRIPSVGQALWRSNFFSLRRGAFAL